MVCFCKQKTAYEIWYGLVGSERCIRDRGGGGKWGEGSVRRGKGNRESGQQRGGLLNTSEAADELTRLAVLEARDVDKQADRRTVCRIEDSCHRL